MNSVSHCPLCVQSLPSLKKDPVLIFLDVDRLLPNLHSPNIGDKLYTTLQELRGKKEDNPTYSGLEWRTAAAAHLDPHGIQNLQNLITRIQKTNPVGIILTSWIADATLQEIREKMFAEHFFAPLIIGKIAPESFATWAPEIKQDYEFENAAKIKYNFKVFGEAERVKHWLQEHNLHKAKFVILNANHPTFSEQFPDHFAYVPYLLGKENLDRAYELLFKKPTDKENACLIL